jgi:GTP cyclohydrolase I
MEFPGEVVHDRKLRGQDLIKAFLLNEITIPGDEVLENTPRRFAEAFRELMGVYDEQSKFTTFESDCDEMIVIKDISFVTLCAHHLLPFIGRAHVGYIPTGRIAGLSKIARAVRTQARGLWAQEDLTMKIADFLTEALAPRGVAVVMEAEHTCMAIRGVKADGSKTTTSAMRGAFREAGNDARAEFLGLIR